MESIHQSFVSKDNNSQNEVLLDQFLELVEDGHSFKQEMVKTDEQKVNFFVPRCSACKCEMQFSEGDVIYGDMWYHNSCWKDTKVEPVSH